jgi:hypothetical protein
LEKPKSGCIVAVTPGMGSTHSSLQELSGVRVVKGEYIEECAAKKEVLDVTPFVLFEGTATPSKKRQLFTHGDDDALIRFVVAQKKTRKIALAGSSLWKLAQAEEVTKHSWQSMRERWRKHLLSSSMYVKALQESGVGEHRHSGRMDQGDTDTMETEGDQRKDKEKEKEKTKGGKSTRMSSKGDAAGMDVDVDVDVDVDDTVESPEEPVEEVLEFVKFAVEAAGVTEAVAYHALYACSGNAQEALDYMLGQEGDFHPWAADDDRNIALACNRVVRQRGLVPTNARKDWMSS